MIKNAISILFQFLIVGVIILSAHNSNASHLKQIRSTLEINNDGDAPAQDSKSTNQETTDSENNTNEDTQCFIGLAYLPLTGYSFTSLIHRLHRLVLSGFGSPPFSPPEE